MSLNGKAQGLFTGSENYASLNEELISALKVLHVVHIVSMSKTVSQWVLSGNVLFKLKTLVRACFYTPCAIG